MARELHVDDIVAKKDNENLLALVERTYGDVDTHDPEPGRSGFPRIRRDKAIKEKAFRKFLRDGVPPKGTVLVRWMQPVSYQLIRTSKLKLVDRSLLIGDIVKRDIKDAMSGVVLNVYTSCTLQPVCDLELNDRDQLRGFLPRSDPNGMRIRPQNAETAPPLVDIPASELECEGIPAEDLVIYKSWLGRAESYAFVLTIRLSDNCVVEVPDHLVKHVDLRMDLFSVGDIVTTKKGTLRQGYWVFGAYNPNTQPVGTVMQTRIASAGIEWLQERVGGERATAEPPAVLERDELESDDFTTYDRTKRLKRGVANETVSNSETEIRVGLKVRFRDLAGAAVKYDGSTRHGKLTRIDRKATLGYDLNVFDVTRFTSEVMVQWQDLSISREKSVDLDPDPSIDDEHAAWPGEVAHTLDLKPVDNLFGVEQPGKVGIIQSVRAEERMATIRWCPNSCMQYSIPASDDPEGVKALLVRKVGEASGETTDVSLYDVETPGEANVRRGDIVIIADAKSTGDANGGEKSANNVDWLGEIVDTNLDGTLVVRLGAAEEVQDLVVMREGIIVAVRSDDLDAFNEFGDDQQDGDSAMQLDWSFGAGSGLPEAFEGSEDGEGSAGDDWDDSLDESDSDDEAKATYEDENGEPLDLEDVEDEEWETADEGEHDDSDGEDSDVTMTDEPPVTQQTPTTEKSTIPITEDSTTSNDTAAESTTGSPEQYLLLSTPVPASHHYASHSSSNASTHAKRTAKEHRILSSAQSLPEGVYVRGWESRLDLLRVLFLGPTETPYANAPFIIDLYLPPSFPTEPPLAFFHSWSSPDGLGGVGRVNPNLYEDGKICLSLLGTWEGNKIEGWSGARCTVLQVLVSVLGLVLVRQPYFNEAGYEHLVDSESCKRPSALYNERAYLRSRAFIIEGLRRVQANADDGVEGGQGNRGVEGLADVLRWLYTAADGPRLLEVNMKDVQAVLERSEKGEEEPEGVHVMSKGACIPLRRALERLGQYLT